MHTTHHAAPASTRRGQTPRCVVTDCFIPKLHAKDCEQHDLCPGCLPGLAADGAIICPHHIRQIGRGAARTSRLFAALEKRLYPAGRPGEHTSGSATGAPVPDQRVMDARTELRNALRDVTALIIERRGIRGPIRWQLRRLPPDIHGPAHLVRVVTGHRDALALFIARHAEWLAAQPEAGRIVELFDELTRPGGDTWRLAFHIGPTSLFVGNCPLDLSPDDGSEPQVCGAPLYQAADKALVTCSGCGTMDTIEQWQRWLWPDKPLEVDAYEGARALSLHWYRSVTPATIRSWAIERPTQKVRAVMVPDPAGRLRPHPGGDRDGEGKPVMVPVMVRKTDARGRTLYLLSDLMVAARGVWGPEPQVPQVKKIA